MAGQRSKTYADFVTPRALYRNGLTGADVGGPEDAAIPILDTRVGPNQVISSLDTNQYGRNAQIVVAAVIKGFSAATLELWLKAEVEDEGLVTEGESSSSQAEDLPATLDWVLVATSGSIAKSGLWIIKDIPPGQYKILFTAKTGSGNLILLEQHAS